MKIIEQNINKLKPYKKNAKKHNKEQVEQIAESIKRFGIVQPAVIDKDNVVVIGHGRILGAKKAGYKTFPCVYADTLTDEQIKALRLADNKLNESAWDFEMLDSELVDISEVDMELFGFDSDMSDEDITKEIEKEVIFKTKEKHLVIITCKNKKETEKVKKEIEQLGYNCEVKNT